MESNELLEEAKRYGFVREGKVYLKPFMDYPERQVGEVKEQDEDALEYFAKKFAHFRQKVDTLLEKVAEAENKGSFLVKLQHLKDQIGSYEAIGDFTQLHKRLTQSEEEIKSLISMNRDKNLATKIGLIQEAEELSESHDWVTATERFKELRGTWIKTGPIDKAITDEVEMRFRTATDKFFQRKKEFFDLKKQMQQSKIDQYRALVHEAEKLQHSEDFEGAGRRLKELQNDWKNVGGTLPKKLMTDLWTRFRAANNNFFERLKVHINTQKSTGTDRSNEEKMTAKRALAEEAESLLDSPPQQATARAKELQAAWKTSGTVKSAESDEVWERFVKACDKIFELANLETVLRKKQLVTDTSSEADNNRARVNMLREFIKGDQNELSILEVNLDKLAPNANNETFRTMLQGKIKIFNRRLQSKQELIDLFKNRATSTPPSE